MPASRQRNVRRLGFRAGAVLSTLVAVLTATVVCRTAIVKAGLVYVLRSAGFPDARFTVEHVGLHEIDLAELSAGEGLRAGQVRLGFDLLRLPENPLERIRIVDAKLDFSSTSKGSTERSRPTAAPGLPVALLPMLELSNLVATVPTSLGTVSIRLDSHTLPDPASLHMRMNGVVEAPTGRGELQVDVRRDAQGALTLTAKLSSVEIRHPRFGIARGSAATRLDASVSGLDLVRASGKVDLASSGVTAGSLRIGALAMTLPIVVERTGDGWLARYSEGSMRFPDQKLELSGISGEASSHRVDFHVNHIIEGTSGRTSEPASLSARIFENQPELRLEADLAAAAGRATLRAEGRYDASRRTAELDVALPRLEFHPGGLRPAEISPYLATAGSASGAVEAKAHVRWRSGVGFSGSAAITADRLSLDFVPVRIDGITGTIDLVGLIPPRTAGVQTLRIHELNPAVPFSGVVLRWALEPAEGKRASRLRIAHFESGFVGGRVSLDDALLDPFSSTNTLDFRFHEIDIARLFELAGFEGVSGTGALSGSIPVTLRGNAIVIPGGRLTAAGGELHVESRAVAELLASGGQPVRLLLDALRNFHYDTLTLTVEKEQTGEAVIRLHLEGRNPDVLEGRPFRVNLNLTGNLDRLTRSLTEVARLSDRAVQATVRRLRREPP